MTERHTNRWWFAVAVAMFAVAAGAITARPLPLFVAVVAVGFATYARAIAPTPAELRLERSLSDREPNPGEAVDVTVTVHNEGGPLADVRVIDGVPPALEVLDGSPRHATALPTGGSATFSYSVRAHRGQHGFDPATVLTRDPAGSVELAAEAEVETILTCLPPLSTVPLQSQTTQYTGGIATDTGGVGLEFHATRAYRPGDDISRIDWNRRAKTGELSTVEFREERAAAVMVVVDARPAANWAAPDADRTAVEHGVAAAGRVFAELLAGGDQVGVTAFGATNCWLPPGAGREHEQRARRLLATHPDLAVTSGADGPPELAIQPDHEPAGLEWLRARLDPDVQVVLVSPLCDDGVTEAARSLHAAGNAVTVVATDVTAGDSLGRRLARLQRRNRVQDLREAGIRVVEWDVSESFGVALARAEVAR